MIETTVVREAHIAEGIACLIIYIMMVISISVTAVQYAIKKTWESLASGCFYYWMPPVWVWYVTWSIPLMFGFSILPLAAIVMVYRIYKESIG